ncbi:tape measure protein [Limosilactobacillus fermentum]
MASDGNVTIEVDLSTSKAKSDAEQVEQILKDIGKDIPGVEVKVSTTNANQEVYDLKKNLDKVPDKKETRFSGDGTQAAHEAEKVKAETDKVPDKKTTRYEADTEEASNHIGLLGRAQQQAESKSTSFTSALKGTAVGMGIYQIAAKAASAVSEQFAGAVSRFDTLNNFPKVMESMGASSKQAHQAIKTLSDGIQGLPTSLDEVATTTQVFMPLSKNANEAAKATLALNDAFLASNATTEDASRGLEQYKQMLANGKVDMMGWRSIEETMPASLQKVAKSFGIASGSTQELYNQLDSGKITMKELNDRFIQLDGGANGFHNTALQATDGIGTAFKNMGTRTKIALANVLTGFNDMVKTLTGSSIGGNINKMTSQFGDIGKAGQQAFEELAKWLKPLTPAFKALGDIIGGIFSGIVSTFKGVGSAISSITKPLQNSAGFAKPLDNALKGIASHKTALKAVGAAIGSIVAGLIAAKGATVAVIAFQKALAGFTAIKNVITSIKSLEGAMALLKYAFATNPVGIVVTAIVALGTAFVMAYKHSKTFRDGVNGVIKAVANTVGSVVKTVTKAFGGLWKSIKPSIDQIAKGFRDLLKILSPVFKAIGIVWNAVWKTMAGIVSTVFKMVTKLVTAGLKAVWTAVKTYAKIIVDIWKLEWDVFKNVVIIVFKVLATVVKTGVRVIKDVIDLVMNIITGNWKGAWNDIKDIFLSVWKGISKIGRDLFGGVRDMIRDVLGDIKGIWEDLWNGMAKFFSNIWDGIKDAAKAGLNGVIGFLNGGINGINSVIHFFGGKKETITPIKKLAHGTSANDRDELALVNDEGGDTYREAIVRTNGQVEIPKNRNQLVYLNRGDEVIPAKRTAEMLGLNRYANGKKGWLSAAWDNVKDWAGDTFEAIEDALKDPLGVLTGLFHKGKNTATAVWHDVGEGAANYLPKVGVNWFKKELQKLEDALTPSNPGGSGVERWKPYIEKAFKELGVAPADWKVAKLLRQINTESSGNPLAWQGVHDVNSGGNEARGLLQFAGSTWRADALPGHTDWRNGYDEILAAIHVLERGGEGGWGNVGNGHGWANGGWADRPSIFGEVKGQKEIAINPFRPTSEHHILEAIRERAAKSPSGFAAQLNQIITRQQMASHQIQPATPSSNEVPTLGNGGRVSGNLTMNFVVDGTTMARVTYPKYKALMAHEITIRGAGGAVPVGQAIPVGGGF